MLAEELVDFRRELAALVARAPSGQAAAYPVVATTQLDGICHEVIAPAPDLDPALAGEAQQLALRVAGELGVTGILAVELFETGDGRILVNELAMRPHNTGHWSQDGAVTSQFENHLRAVLDLPLGSPAPRARWTVMVNILGSPSPDVGHLYDGYPHALARDPQLRVHLYGKELRPVARSATSTRTATTWTTCSNGPATPRPGSAATSATTATEGPLCACSCAHQTVSDAACKGRLPADTGAGRQRGFEGPASISHQARTAVSRSARPTCQLVEAREPHGADELAVALESGMVAGDLRTAVERDADEVLRRAVTG